jgi:uncharacterized membrane protein
MRVVVMALLALLVVVAVVVVVVVVVVMVKPVSERKMYHAQRRPSENRLLPIARERMSETPIPSQRWAHQAFICYRSRVVPTAKWRSLSGLRTT